MCHKHRGQNICVRGEESESPLTVFEREALSNGLREGRIS